MLCCDKYKWKLFTIKVIHMTCKISSLVNTYFLLNCSYISHKLIFLMLDSFWREITYTNLPPTWNFSSRINTRMKTPANVALCIIYCIQRGINSWRCTASKIWKFILEKKLYKMEYVEKRKLAVEFVHFRRLNCIK